MCGRYTLASPDPSQLRARFPIGESIEIRRRYNVAPGDDVLAVVRPRDAPEPEGALLRWGLVPFWASSPGEVAAKTINARAETVAEKPMFREAFKRRRCLVPASGYFEWKPEGAAKQPYFIHDADNTLLMFAGLWEAWRETKEAEPLYTYTIIVGPPGVVSGDIHDRAPVMLPDDAWDIWLSGDVAGASAVLERVHEPTLTYHAVSKAVGSPKNDAPGLVEPIDT